MTSEPRGKSSTKKSVGFLRDRVGGGFMALVIDMGYAFFLDNKVQVTADASALAGASQLVDANADGIPDDQAYTEAAIEYAYENMAEVVHGTIIDPACGTYNAGARIVSGANDCDDVKAGYWNAAARSFTAWDDPAFDNSTMDLDAVRVRTHRTQATGNPVSTSFAALFGLPWMNVNNYAVAWAPTGGAG